MKRTHRQTRSGKLQRRQLAGEALEDRRLLAMLTQLHSSLGGYICSPFVPFAGSSYFLSHIARTDEMTSPGLWKSDGTTEGTSLVNGDFYPGGMVPAEPVAIDGKMYFAAGTYESGIELWASDGTDVHTQIVKDLVAGEGGSIPQGVTAFQRLAYFIGLDQDGAPDLWRSDGTHEGTTLAADFDIQNGASLRILRAIGDGLLLCGSGWLWRFDALFGAAPLAEVDCSSGAERQGNVSVGNVLYFIGHDQGGKGLWRTDGSSAGTTRVNQDAWSAIGALEGSVYFSPINANQLQRVDAVSGESTVVKEFGVGPGCGGVDRFLQGQALLYFFRNDCKSGQDVVWRTDGTEAGTFQLSDANVFPGMAVNWIGALFFGGDLWKDTSDYAGAELWRSDGTVTGTVMVQDISPGEVGSFPRQLSVSNGVLFFWGNKDDLDPKTSDLFAWSWRPASGDTNFDGSVDLTDLNNVRNNFGYVGDDRPGDVTGDGAVDLEDLNEVRNHYGEGAALAAVAPSAQVFVSTPPTAARDHALETLIWLRSSHGSDSNSFDALPKDGVRNIGRSQRNHSR